MAFFEWSDSFSVGNEEIDRQHQTVIQLINQLHRVVVQRNEADTIDAVLGELDTMSSVIDELIHYSSIHFAAEESVMLEKGYPGYESHKETHLEFTNRVLDFSRAFREGHPLRSEEILLFIRSWWQDHILGVDKKYVPYLKKPSAS